MSSPPHFHLFPHQQQALDFIRMTNQRRSKLTHSFCSSCKKNVSHSWRVIDQKYGTKWECDECGFLSWDPNFRPGDRVVFDAWNANEILTITHVEHQQGRLYLRFLGDDDRWPASNYRLYDGKNPPSLDKVGADSKMSAMKRTTKSCDCAGCSCDLGHCLPGCSLGFGEECPHQQPGPQGLQGSTGKREGKRFSDWGHEWPPANEGFRLHPNASRRTKQRWRAHQAGNCKPGKCSHCKREAKKLWKHSGKIVSFNLPFSASDTKQAENRLLRNKRQQTGDCGGNCDCVCAVDVLMFAGCRCGSMERCICFAPTHCTCGYLEKRHAHKVCGGASECGFCMDEQQCERDKMSSVVCNGRDECQICAHGSKLAASVDKVGEPGIINPCQEVSMSKHDSQMSQNASEVLQQQVANNYLRAAKQVARSRAEVEVFAHAMIPGMMVWHRYNRHSCILLMETQPGFWTIEMADGTTESEVPASILTPIRPNIFQRSWLLLRKTLHNILYHEVEVETQRGSAFKQELNTKLMAFGMLSFVVLSLVAHFIGSFPL